MMSGMLAPVDKNENVEAALQETVALVLGASGTVCYVNF